jgi:hypothetical protein
MDTGYVCPHCMLTMKLGASVCIGCGAELWQGATEQQYIKSGICCSLCLLVGMGFLANQLGYSLLTIPALAYIAVAVSGFFAGAFACHKYFEILGVRSIRRYHR